MGHGTWSLNSLKTDINSTIQILRSWAEITLTSTGVERPEKRRDAFLSAVLQPSRHRDSDVAQKLQVSAVQWFNELTQDDGNARDEASVSPTGVWHGEGSRCHFEVLRRCNKMAFFRTGQQRFGMAPGILREGIELCCSRRCGIQSFYDPKGRMGFNS
jgi:hypothetical protein